MKLAKFIILVFIGFYCLTTALIIASEEPTAAAILFFVFAYCIKNSKAMIPIAVLCSCPSDFEGFCANLNCSKAGEITVVSGEIAFIRVLSPQCLTGLKFYSYIKLWRVPSPRLEQLVKQRLYAHTN